MEYKLVNVNQLLAAVLSNDKEYFACVSQYYGKEVVSAIKQGDAMAKNMTNSKIKTEKSDSGNLIVRWSEGNNMVAILGVVSTSGKLKRSDLPDFNIWVSGIIDRLKRGFKICTSPNKLSKPLFDKVVKRAEKEGLNINVQSYGETEFGGMTWENVMIEAD